MVTIIAVANAVVWGGLFLGLLLLLTRNAGELDSRLTQLEAAVGKDEDAEA